MPKIRLIQVYLEYKPDNTLSYLLIYQFTTFISDIKKLYFNTQLKNEN